MNTDRMNSRDQTHGKEVRLRKHGKALTANLAMIPGVGRANFIGVPTACLNDKH